MICAHCGHVFFGKNSCMMRECPHCYRKWASKESKVAGWRFWTGCKYVRINRCIAKENARRVHCVISFPDVDPLDILRQVAIQIAKRHGLLGGLMVWHPFRQDEDGAFVPDGYVHFHLLAFANGDIGEGGTDGAVVFKHIRHPVHGDFNGFRSLREVQKCAFYLLTHCGIVKGRHSLTWWGDLSYNMLSTERLDQEFEGRELACHVPGVPCPVCGSRDTELLRSPNEYGWPSQEPLHHGLGYGVPWGG